MTSTVKIFDYIKPTEDKPQTRIVFVLNENDEYLQGLELKRLDPTQRARVQLLLQDHTVGVPMFGEERTNGLEDVWKDAFRCFRKERIVSETFDM